MKLFDSDCIPLGNFFGEKKQLLIPENQREYRWEKKQVEILFEDLYNSFERLGKKDYFIGNIVLFQKDPKEKYYKIIDGQQRIITLLILFEVIKSKFNGIDSPYSKENIETIQDYLSVKSIEKGITKNYKKLVASKNNEESFDLFIQSKDSENNRKIEGFNEGSNKNIKGAYYSLNVKIDNTLKDKSDLEKMSYLGDFFSYISENIYVTLTKVYDEEKAYLIFEVLNDRGLDLEPHEKIKNHILWKLTISEKKDFNILWNNISKKFLNNMDDYLYQFLLSKYGKFSQQNIFNKFREEVPIKEFLKFTQQLNKEFQEYDKLKNPERYKEFWVKRNKEELDSLLLLKLLRKKQVFTTLLSALINFKKEDFQKLLDYMVCFSFKFKFIGKLPASTENLFPDLAKRIRENNISVDKVIEEIEKKVKISSKKLKDKFFDSELNSDLQKKLLILINNYYLKNSKGLTMDNKLTREHLFKENENKEIRKEDAEKISEMKFTYKEEALYNLTLLTKKDNENLKNKNYNKKIKTYSNYGYVPTTIFFKDKEFNQELIEHYQNYLWVAIEKIFNLN